MNTEFRGTVLKDYTQMLTRHVEPAYALYGVTLGRETSRNSKVVVTSLAWGATGLPCEYDFTRAVSHMAMFRRK